MAAGTARAARTARAAGAAWGSRSSKGNKGSKGNKEIPWSGSRRPERLIRRPSGWFEWPIGRPTAAVLALREGLRGPRGARRGVHWPVLGPIWVGFWV